MIKVKHLMDVCEKDDGERIWVEPFGLTLDLRQWCSVDHVLPHLGPSMKIWRMLEEHPDAYEYFRAQYHDQLKRSPYKTALQTLATAAIQQNFTLIHSSDNPEHNSAAALHEFLSELQAYKAEEQT